MIRLPTSRIWNTMPTGFGAWSVTWLCQLAKRFCFCRFCPTMNGLQVSSQNESSLLKQIHFGMVLALDAPAKTSRIIERTLLLPSALWMTRRWLIICRSHLRCNGKIPTVTQAWAFLATHAIYLGSAREHKTCTEVDLFRCSNSCAAHEVGSNLCNMTHPYTS